MLVKKNFHKTNATAPHLPEGNYLSKRIGFWALVKDVNSINNTVTVISDTGFIFPNIPVISNEWVTVDDSKDYIPSTRNLPPKNSRVFVLTPTYTATGAFVLCSGFSRGDENIRTLWAADENELEDKNNCRETKTQGGWDITEEYSNGNFTAKSNDEDIEININPVEDTQKSQKKEISLIAWENEIIINEDGIEIKDANNNKIEATSNGLTVTDSNNNKIEFSSSGIKITDANNNIIESSSNGIKLTNKNNNVIEMGASSVKINNHLEVTL